jgi:hypothetical protein
MRDEVLEVVATRVAEGVAAAVACLMETADGEIAESRLM